MEGSGSKHSYAANSAPQRSAFDTISQPHLSDAIAIALDQYVSNSSIPSPLSPHHHHRPPFTIADLGCSYGPNPLLYCSFITSEVRRRLLAAPSPYKDDDPFELLYYFSDLPTNDFNALFASYANRDEHLVNKNNVQSDKARNGVEIVGNASETGEIVTPIDFRLYAAAMPGSFYTRIFPNRSLHLIFISASLHWLSQVPREVIDPTSDAWSGSNVWLNPSRPQITEAFARQSQRDLAVFLRCRAEEMASGGLLFLVTVTVALKEQFFQLDQLVWDELVSEGVISGEERNTFNVPIYMFSAAELHDAISAFSGEFELLRTLTFDNWSGLPDDELKRLVNDPPLFATFWANFMAGVTKPLLRKHLGSARATLFVERSEQVAARLGPNPAVVLCDVSVTILRRTH